MNKQILFLLSTAVILSCTENKTKEKVSTDSVNVKKADTLAVKKDLEIPVKSEQINPTNLPEWILKSNVINQSMIKNDYKIEDWVKPSYLEEDFNGDDILDIAVPISEIKTNKKGFAVIHGKTFEVFILGAGKLFKYALSDNQDYIDSWTINRKKENEPGVEEETGNGENGFLILKNPSIEIDKSEVGGGQIYWNGSEYAYFHQTD